METMSEELRKLSNRKSSIKFTTIYPAVVLTGICKPKARFPRITREFSPQQAASSIIDAQRRNYKNKSIPSYMLSFILFLRVCGLSSCLLSLLMPSAMKEDTVITRKPSNIIEEDNRGSLKYITMIMIEHVLLFLIEILLLILKVLYYICKDVYKLIIPIRKKSVAGEIVLITGAGHGIGKELAIGYASLGATVVCWDINEETNNKTMEDIKKMGRDSVYAYRCNVADNEEVLRIAKKVKEEVGDVTILINNAGIAFVKSFLDQSPDEIKRVIDINVTAHYWTLKAFLPDMVKQNYGHIVAISSMAAFFCGPYGTVYCPSKIAVKVIMDSLSEELRVLSKGKSSIKFTTVHPTFVHTGICKIPKFRFPLSLILDAFSPQKMASSIIDAQRRDYENKSILSYWLFISKITRLLPEAALRCIVDFADIRVCP